MRGGSRKEWTPSGGLLVAGLYVTVVAAALEGTAATVLFAMGLPAMLAGVMILESARRRR